MTRKDEEVPSERLHFVMPPKTKAVLDEIQARTGARSMAEVIRRAIALYDVVSDEVAQHGSAIILRSPDGTETRVKVV